MRHAAPDWLGLVVLKHLHIFLPEKKYGFHKKRIIDRTPWDPNQTILREILKVKDRTFLYFRAKSKKINKEKLFKGAEQQKRRYLR